jgi:hypothetical protein
MGFTYPPIISDSSLYNPRFYPSLGTDGTLTYEYAQTLYLSRNDYRLSYLSGVTPGAATSGSAIVLDETLSLSGLGSISCSALTVGGVAVGTLPSFLTGITPGTAANNKALVLGGSGEIATITSLTATSIYGSIKTAAQPNITSLGTQNEAIATTFANDTNALLTYAIWTNSSATPVSCKLQMSNQGVSFIGGTNHPLRLGTNGSNILYLQPSGNVSIGSSLDTHKLYVSGSIGVSNSISTSNSSRMSEYALGLCHPISTNGSRVGICFGVSSNQMDLYTGGASIVHTRSDVNSVGGLTFNVRSNSIAVDPLVEAFRINADGSTAFNYPMTIDGNLVFSGSARTISGLSSISATTLIGTLSTAAQTAITSVGALNGLTIDGNLLFSGVARTISGLSSISATTITGAVSGAQTGITAVGILSNLTLSTGGTGLQIPNLKFYNSTTVSYDNFDHSAYVGFAYGGAVASKALVVDSNKDIGSIRNLDAVNINGFTKVSGALGDFGSVSISGTSIITSSRHLQNIGDATISGTFNAYAGYKLNGATLVDSTQNIFAASVLADYAQLDKAAPTTYSSTSKSNEYNLA